jgi:hypothetical protein
VRRDELELLLLLLLLLLYLLRRHFCPLSAERDQREVGAVRRGEERAVR